MAPLVKALVCLICMLLLLNLIINYLTQKSEANFELSTLRNVYKYAHIFGDRRNISMMMEQGHQNATKHFQNKTTVIISIPNKEADEEPSRRLLTILGKSLATNATLLECGSPITADSGPIIPKLGVESLDVVESELQHMLSAGGAYEPTHCKAKDHVAIVVPFRDRYAHLSIFLRNIHPFLMKQHIAYRIFVIEQINGKLFNRAALMNIGFLEALRFYKWDCFIFHDVDLLPLDDRNIYNCPRQPRHMSVAIDTLDFTLPYRSIFGGVSAMTRQHFQLVNGFSNSYFGWGGEDDDMSNRLKYSNLFIARYPINIARYKMLTHQKEKANPKRFENLVNGITKMKTDGLNSIKYKIYSMEEFPLYTWCLADVKVSDRNS